MTHREALNLTEDYRQAVLRTSAYREIADMVPLSNQNDEFVRNQRLWKQALDAEHTLWKRLMKELGAPVIEKEQA